MGGWFRKATGCATDGDYSTYFFGRKLLFHQHASSDLAEGEPLQSSGLFDQRLSVEFFWQRGHQPCFECKHDILFHDYLHGHHRHHLQDRLSNKKLG